MNTDPFQTLSSEIVSIVSAAWEKNNSPIVLAKVGTVLSSNAKDELEDAGRKLKPYILTQMTDRIRYIGSPKYGDFVAPLIPSENLSDDELIQRYENSRTVTESISSGTRFKSDIWNGFTISPKAGRRYICFNEQNEPKLKYQSEIFGETRDCYEIMDSDLAFDDQGNRVSFQRVGELILEWAHRNAIEVHKLYPTRESPIDRTELRKAVNQEKQTSKEMLVVDSLISVMNMLSKEELSRVSIPADIVVKLVSFARKHS